MYLIRAEQNHQCYACYLHHTNPKASGGLAFVNAPNTEGIMHPILDKNEMEDMLLEFSRTHFAKAKGTPFTTGPLGQLLAYDGMSTYGQKVFQGQPKI